MGGNSKKKNKCVKAETVYISFVFNKKCLKDYKQIIEKEVKQTLTELVERFIK